MRKSRFTEAQIIAILKQAEGGAKVVLFNETPATWLRLSRVV